MLNFSVSTGRSRRPPQRAVADRARGDRILRATRGADGSLSSWAPDGAPLPADASGARLAIVGDRLYVIAPGVLHVATLDAAGAPAGWESHPDDAPPPLPVAAFDVAVVADRLYVWGDALLLAARVDAATGRLRAWP